MGKVIIADNNMANSDWLKSARWDLPFTTVEEFAKYKGIKVADAPFLISELGKFIELPAYNAAPESFKADVRRYFGGIAKSIHNDAVLKFNPDQPRDENGRFAESDGGGGYDAAILDRFDKTTPPPVIGQPGVWQSRLIPPGQVASVVAAKTAYIKSKGYELRDIDYLQIAADPERGKVIADMFDTLPSFDENALPAYEALRSEVKEQFDYLVNDMGIKVDVVEQDPYKNGSEMMADLEQNGHISVLSTAATGGHPLFTNEENDMFRAVHDVFGHAGAGTNFDRNGEEASFISHFQMFSPLAAQALATETRGQNSWLTYSGNDTFAEQKIALLPPVMTLPYPNEGQQDAQALLKSWKFTGDDEGWNEDRFGVVNVSLGRYRLNQVATKSFDPDQPRDENGRFANGSGALGTSPKSLEVAARISNVTREPSEDIFGDGRRVFHRSEAVYVGENGTEYKLKYAIEESHEGWEGKGDERHRVYRDSAELSGQVFAYKEGSSEPVGSLTVTGKTEGYGDDKIFLPVMEVEQVVTKPSEQRQGVATAMLEFARGESPVPIVHGGAVSPDGEGFINTVKSFDPNQERDERGRWTVLETLPIDDAWKANFATDAGASARANMVDGKFTEERQKLHRKILREAFKGVKKPDGQPAVYFLGGGAASGKSTAIEDGSLGVPTADSGLAVHIDPDALKEELPEYQEMSRALDTGAAAFVHEESSYLANSIAAIAREAGYNVVLDGVNSSMKVADKIEDYRELGYKVEGHYVTRPTAEAVNNNQGRFDRAVAKLEAGDENVFPRYVPADRVIAGHEEVSKNFESLAPLFDRATLTDMTGNQRTTVGETTYGQPFTPMAEAAPLYQSFLAKGN